MKIQRNTLVLALVAFGLASGIYIQQRLTAPESPSEVRTEGAEPLFYFDEADVVQFTINRPDLTLSLEKRSPESTGDAVADLDAETAALGQPDWAIILPEQTPASDGAVAFLLNLLATGDRRDSFPIPNDGQSQGLTQQRLAEFGLDEPQAQVELTLADGTTHQLMLGNRNFDDSATYAVQDVDPSDEEIDVFLVNSSLEPALLRSLEEWRYTAELPDEPTESETSPDNEATPSGELEQEAVELELPLVELGEDAKVETSTDEDALEEGQ